MMKQIQDAAERSDTVVYAVGLLADGDASGKERARNLTS
jgi:hypothetical protein